MIALSSNPWLSLVALAFLLPPECRPDDAGRFPTLAVARWGWDVSYQSANFLEFHPPLGKHRLDAWQYASDEQHWRCQCWVKLYYVRYSYEHAGYPYTVAERLDELRKLIGDGAYSAGHMPHPIGGY